VAKELTNEEKDLIRALYETGEVQTAHLAKTFKISKTYVESICGLGDDYLAHKTLLVRNLKKTCRWCWGTKRRRHEECEWQMRHMTGEISTEKLAEFLVRKGVSSLD
jgi:hypothetical protein